MSGLVWSHNVICQDGETVVNVTLRNPDQTTVIWVEFWGDLAGQPNRTNFEPGATATFVFKVKGSKTIKVGANALYPVGRRDPDPYQIDVVEQNCSTEESITITTVAATTTTTTETTTTTTVEPTTTTRGEVTGSVISATTTLPTQSTLPRTGKEQNVTIGAASGLLVAGLLMVALVHRGRNANSN